LIDTGTQLGPSVVSERPGAALKKSRNIVNRNRRIIVRTFMILPPEKFSA